MTHAERLFVSALKRGDSKILSQVKKEWLDKKENRQLTFIMDQYKKSGELIGIKAFCDKFSLDSHEADSRPAYYLEEVKKRFIFTSVSDNISSIIKGIKDEPRENLKKLESLVARLAVDSVESIDRLYSDNADDRLAEYTERSTSGGVTYLSMGFTAMDENLFGYKPADLITIGGKAGQGKSWLLVLLTYVLERVILDKEEELGATLGDILFITNEMPSEEIIDRIDCIKFKLPVKDFNKGSLSHGDLKRYQRGLKRFKDKPSKIRLIESCMTIEELQTYIGIYKPSVIFIDGSYLMEPQLNEGWEKIVYVTRNLKRLAKSNKVPIVNTTQLKRGSSKGETKHLEGQDDFAYSSSYSQDSDIAIRLYQTPDMLYHSFVGMEVVKGRRVEANTRFIFQNDLSKMNLTIVNSEPDEEPAMEVETDYD